MAAAGAPAAVAGAAPDPPADADGHGAAAPSRAGGATTARLVAPVTARSAPADGRAVTRLGVATSWSRQPQTLLVLRSARVLGREWIKVLLPVRPNGAGGWIPRDRVILGHSSIWIEVRVGARRVVVFRDGARVRSYRAVVGRGATPTPAGLAALYERNRQPDPEAFLGPWSLSLTVFSPVLRRFDGGPGRVAIHGRGVASFSDPLGSAASHGCIRIPNAGIRWLAANAPLGTPVLIVR